MNAVPLAEFDGVIGVHIRLKLVIAGLDHPWLQI